MKNTLLSICLLFVSTMLFAQLYTPGTGVRWNLDSLLAQSALTPSSNGNYYLLGDDVTISLNDTVELLGNDSIKVSAGKLITVEGVLYLNPPQEIVITALNPAQRFLGFRFDGSDGSVLQNANISYAGGIKLVDADVTFESCSFSDFDKTNCTGTIDAFQSHPMIRNCSFIENAGPAVASGANAASSPQIYYNYIYHNNTSNANTPQINLGTSGSDTIRIIGNTVEGFYDMGGGIAVSTLFGGSVIARIDSNQVTNNRYGIACLGSGIDALIRHNYIADNNIQNLPMQGGSGINLYGGPTNNAIVSHNEITGNLWGITLQINAQPNLGQIEPDTTNIGWNRIYANGNGGVTYNLYNNTPGNIKAENNYWGSYAQDTVEAGIFHQPDDGTLGFVDYLPLSPVITAVESLQEAHASSLVKQLYPNPVHGVLKLEFEDVIVNTEKSLEMFDLGGRLVFNATIPSGVPSYQVSTAGLIPGHYLLQLTAGQQKQTLRVVVSAD